MLQWTTSSSLCSAPPRHWTPQRATQRHQWRKCCRPALQLQYQKPNNDSGSQTAHHAHCAQTPTTPTTITHLLARSAASATTDPSSTHSWSCPGTPRRPSLAQRSRQWRIPGSCTPTDAAPDTVNATRPYALEHAASAHAHQRTQLLQRPAVLDQSSLACRTRTLVTWQQTRCSWERSLRRPRQTRCCLALRHAPHHNTGTHTSARDANVDMDRASQYSAVAARMTTVCNSGRQVTPGAPPVSQSTFPPRPDQYFGHRRASATRCQQLTHTASNIPLLKFGSRQTQQVHAAHRTRMTERRGGTSWWRACDRVRVTHLHWRL